MNVRVFRGVSGKFYLDKRNPPTPPTPPAINKDWSLTTTGAKLVQIKFGIFFYHTKIVHHKMSFQNGSASKVKQRKRC